MTVQAQAAQESFYRQMWAAKAGHTKPAVDEQLRFERIGSYLERIRALDGKPIRRAIDVGCGRGWMCAALRHRGIASVVGIDPISSSVESAQQQFPDGDYEVAGPAEYLDRHGGGLFDLALSSEVIEHVPYADQPTFLAGLRDLVRPGGWIILTTPRGEMWDEYAPEAPWLQPVENWLTHSQLAGLASKAGLETVLHEPLFIRFALKKRWASRLIHSKFFLHHPSLAERFPLRRLRDAKSLYQSCLLRRS